MSTAQHQLPLGFFVGNHYTMHDWDSAVQSTAQGLLLDSRDVLKLSSSFTYVPMYNIPAFPSTNLRVGITLLSTTVPSLPSISNSGSVIKMRPIACSALVTCTLPEINAGGNIVAYSAPSGDIDNYFYNTSGQIGPLQEWENLARVNKGALIHDGNYKDGAYVWTQPWDKNDCLLRTPLEALAYPYQGIIVSGQLNPSVALTGLINVGRIRIAMVYEYTSDNRLFMGESCYGTTGDLDWVLSYLGPQVHASENSDHLDKLRKIVSDGTKVITKSIPTVMKGMETVGKAAALLL